MTCTGSLPSVNPFELAGLVTSPCIAEALLISNFLLAKTLSHDVFSVDLLPLIHRVFQFPMQFVFFTHHCEPSAGHPSVHPYCLRSRCVTYLPLSHFLWWCCHRNNRSHSCTNVFPCNRWSFQGTPAENRCPIAEPPAVESPASRASHRQGVKNNAAPLRSWCPMYRLR